MHYHVRATGFDTVVIVEALVAEKRRMAEIVHVPSIVARELWPIRTRNLVGAGIVLIPPHLPGLLVLRSINDKQQRSPDEVCMPAGLGETATLPCLFYSRPPTMLAALALLLCTSLVTARAHPRQRSLALSADTLSTGADAGGSHILLSIDNPAASIASQSAGLRTAAYGTTADVALGSDFDAAAVDPATVRLGAVLQTGTASWYGTAWKGRRTASGSRFNPEAMTAASPHAPAGDASIGHA